jgi:mRNA-degrading endonuclease toxin of MazEF toxin-antitoxin module
MQKGELWQVDIPFSPGHAQAGQRPAVILQDDPFLATLPTILIVPFTGSQRATRFPATVLVQPDAQNGLTVASVALVFQTRALDARFFLYRLGALDATRMDQILKQLDKLTGR